MVWRYSRYSNISPGWQSNSRQIASRVLKRTPFALPVFSIERFTLVTPTRCASSLSEIFLLDIMTSRLMMIAILNKCFVFLFE